MKDLLARTKDELQYACFVVVLYGASAFISLFGNKADKKWMRGER